MVLQYREEKLNYFKFADIVVDEFPKALRQAFKLMWDDKFGPAHLWDDSPTLRNLFLTAEGGTTKVPTHLSYEEWDCTALFKATIYAKTFAVPVVTSTGHNTMVKLSDRYVTPYGVLPHGSFHKSVVSPRGNKDETFALAIDQLRLLRNSHFHSNNSAMDRATFDQRLQLSKDAFKALGVMTDQIDEVESTSETHFPTRELASLRRENHHMRFFLFV